MSDFKGANSNPQEFFYKAYSPPEYHRLLMLITSSATQNTMNASIGILLDPHAKLALGSIETISERTMIETFNGNPKCTVISTYSPTNVTSEDTIQEYYSELTTLIHQVPKHNVLFLCGDMNAQVGPTSGKHHYH